MDCTTARQLLPYARPGLGELDPAERHALQRHLAGCAGCRAEERTERTFDEQIGRAMQAVAIPIDLKPRLLAGLAAERQRAYRRWFAVGVTAAAAVLLVAVLGYSWYWKVEQDRIVYDLLPEPEDWPAKVYEHFRNEGFPIALPRDLIDNWDFNLLVKDSMTFSTYNGKNVPTLTFRKGSATATVRILRRGQFNADELAGLRPGVDPGRCVLGNPARDEYIALVHFSAGAKWEDFLHPQERVA